MTSASAAIHIVDDDASFRTSMGRLLGACGYAVETYGSAEQLLKRLPNGAGAGCILLDINMPGVNGPELQTPLNALRSSLPIIFLTGHADIPTTVHVIKAGAEDLLPKPVAKDSLVQEIERALARAAPDYWLSRPVEVECSGSDGSWRQGCSFVDPQAFCALA